MQFMLLAHCEQEDSNKIMKSAKNRQCSTGYPKHNRATVLELLIRLARPSAGPSGDSSGAKSGPLLNAFTRTGQPRPGIKPGYGETLSPLTAMEIWQSRSVN